MQEQLFFSKGGTLYEVAGYHHYRSGRDVFSHDRVMDYTINGAAIQRKIAKAVDFYSSEYSLGDLDDLLLRSFGLEPSDCFEVLSRVDFRLAVVLKKTKATTSIFCKTEKDPFLFIRKYLLAGGKIHRLRSNVNSVIDFCIKQNEQRKPITVESIGLFATKPGLVQSSATKEKKKSALKSVKDAYEAKERNELRPIVFEDEYNDELRALRQSICMQAKKNGGFVEVMYGEQRLMIPRAPFILWATRRQRKDISMVWSTLSPSDLKVDNDCQLHSDWWIGAGLPLYAYKLAERGFLYYALDEILFRASCNVVPVVGDVIMNKYHLGGTPSSEQEMRMIAGSYITKGLAHHLPIASIINVLESKGFKVSF